MITRKAINRRDKHSGVNAAVTVRDMVRYLEVILFEREARMPNWPFNMEVFGHGRSYRDPFR